MQRCTIYIDQNHGHVGTRDLQLIKNNMLCKLCKGPKYRKHISIVFHNANKNGPEISRITRITNICNKFRASSKALVNGAQNHGGQPVVSIRKKFWSLL